MLHKGLLVMAILCLLCLVVQLLPIISVPITGKGTNYSIYLSHYQNYKFGVFGLCDVTMDVCSDAKIGYPSSGNSFYDVVSDGYEAQFGGVELPSKARYTISKLLVVHVVSFCLSGCLFLVILLLMVIYSYENTPKLRIIENFTRWPKGKRIIVPQNENEIINATEGGNGNDSIPKPSSDDTKRPQEVTGKKKRDIAPLLNLMLLLSLLAFMSTLLAFLSDILLFVPNLSYLGWLQFYPIFAIALMASMICFMKRSITSRRYLEDSKTYQYSDEMRLRRSLDIVDESDSDDGFYVYTNGFYSTYDNNEERHHRPVSTGAHNGWRRHTPRNDDQEHPQDSDANLTARDAIHDESGLHNRSHHQLSEQHPNHNLQHQQEHPHFDFQQRDVELEDLEFDIGMHRVSL